MSEELKIYLRLEKQESYRFLQIKNYLGLKNDTEVLRSVINDYWRDHQKEFPARLEHHNLNEDGVFIQDRDENWIFQVAFKPEGIRCECGVPDCKHIRFALSVPNIQKVIRKRRSEGWKLPEV